MAFLSLLVRAAIFVLLFAVVTATTKPFGGSDTVGHTSLAAATPASTQSDFATVTTTRILPPLSPSVTPSRPLKSEANLTTIPEVNLLVAGTEAEEWTCERAEREAKEARHQRCNDFMVVVRLRCWNIWKGNCCVKGKGPATCVCSWWWPRGAPYNLPPGKHCRS